MSLIDFECPDAGGVVDGRILITLHSFIRRVSEGQELHVDLKVVARHLLLVTLPELHTVLPHVARQSVQAVALKDVGDPDETLMPWERSRYQWRRRWPR